MSKSTRKTESYGISISNENIEYIDEVIKRGILKKRSTIIDAILTRARKKRWFLDE